MKNLFAYNPFVEIKRQLHHELQSKEWMTNGELLEWIEHAVFTRTEPLRLPASERKYWIDHIFYSLRGLDVLQPLLNDPEVTEIMVNRFDRIFIEKQGELQAYPMSFESSEKLEDIIQLIVGQVNRAVNEASPVVDARLLDGSRVNVVLPPLALDGPALTIRKFPEQPLQAADLLQMKTWDSEVQELLKQLVAAKYNIFISGGTGSGKTTLLSVLAQFIPQDERMITIEDSAELQLSHFPNLVRMETRNANTEGKGEVPIRQLIRTALRMRPSRIIVGEVRGAEALDMLQAMNTGHDGSLSTGHSNSAHDMLSRLETMVMSTAAFPLEVVRQQIASAIDIIIHISRLRDRTRRIVEIAELDGCREGQIKLRHLYQFEYKNESEEDCGKGEILRKIASLKNSQKLDQAQAGFK